MSQNKYTIQKFRPWQFPVSAAKASLEQVSMLTRNPFHFCKSNSFNKSNTP